MLVWQTALRLHEIGSTRSEGQRIAQSVVFASLLWCDLLTASLRFLSPKLLEFKHDLLTLVHACSGSTEAWIGFCHVVSHCVMPYTALQHNWLQPLIGCMHQALLHCIVRCKNDLCCTRLHFMLHSCTSLYCTKASVQPSDECQAC